MNVPYTQSTGRGRRRQRAPSRPSVVSKTRCATGSNRACPGSQRPRSSTSPPPAMPAPGVARSVSTRVASAPGSRRASGFTKTSTSPRAAIPPWVAAAAKPTFAAFSIRRTSRWCARTAAALPSVEALSTTTTSPGPAASTLATQAASASPAFQLTMTTETVTRGRTAGSARQLRGEDLTERAELALREQPPQTGLGPVDVHAMAEARQRRGPGHGRLVRIELPGVEVHDRRLPLRVDAGDRPPRDRERQQPEPAPARDRPVAAREVHGAHRKLPEPGAETHREPPRAAEAGPLAAPQRAVRVHRLEARVVAEPVRPQHVERPQRGVGQREPGRPVAEHAIGATERATDGRERAR